MDPEGALLVAVGHDATLHGALAVERELGRGIAMGRLDVEILQRSQTR